MGNAGVIPSTVVYPWGSLYLCRDYVKASDESSEYMESDGRELRLWGFREFRVPTSPISQGN